ncbi:MAG TPA: oxidoreductase [Bacteroidales bacterium]|nr:oxidoreductase [Bacteroidales bacterium]HBZ20104.1 oxidoreductase [Bacteroidales bacterium]
MNLHRVQGIRNLSDSTFILCFEKNDIKFVPGQHINVGLPGEDDRPYSIYNGVKDDHLEILIKEIPNGYVSRKLKLMEPGKFVSVDQPNGDFTIEREIMDELPFWLICTGTGISPFHSFVASYPGLKYRIIHGIRYSNESYEHKKYSDGTYLSCTSGDKTGDFNGRVTEYLANTDIEKQAYYYVCGSYEMIDQVYDLLIYKGISKAQIKTEGYF